MHVSLFKNWHHFIKCEWLYSPSINIYCSTDFISYKSLYAGFLFFYTHVLTSSRLCCFTFTLLNTCKMYRYDIWIYKVFILWKLCRKCCFCFPTFNPRGVVYLPTNWPLTSPPGPFSLSGTKSSLLASPSDFADFGGRWREPPSTTEVKSLGWNRFSCCNFSGFWDSVAENNSFWSLNRIHTSWS